MVTVIQLQKWEALPFSVHLHQVVSLIFVNQIVRMLASLAAFGRFWDAVAHSINTLQLWELTSILIYHEKCTNCFLRFYLTYYFQLILNRNQSVFLQAAELFLWSAQQSFSNQTELSSITDYNIEMEQNSILLHQNLNLSKCRSKRHSHTHLLLLPCLAATKSLQTDYLYAQ